MQLLRARQNAGFNICVGLDTDAFNKKFPQCLLKKHQGNISKAVLEFNKILIDATADLAACFKINSAFYEQYGEENGALIIKNTVAYIHENYPEIPVIVDAKRGDIDSTNDGYVRAHFNFQNADGITVPPYMGRESLMPILSRADKIVFVLARTSNKGAGEFQNLEFRYKVDVPEGDLDDGWRYMPLYQKVATNVANDWNDLANLGVVVGATSDKVEGEITAIRTIIWREMQMLIPGVGAQGGDLRKAVQAATTLGSRRFILNLSRSVIFASSGENFAQAARAELEARHAEVAAIVAQNCEEEIDVDTLSMDAAQLLALDPYQVAHDLTAAELLHIAKTLGGFWEYDYAAADAGRPGLHAELKSGLHSDGFFMSKAILEHGKLRVLMALQLINKIRMMIGNSRMPDYICGVPDGATKLGQTVAMLLGAKHAILKKVEGKIIMETRIQPGETLLFIEDICTRGTGFSEAVRTVKNEQPHVAIFPFDPVLLNRGGLKTFDVDGLEIMVLAIVDKKLTDWDPNSGSCHLCNQYGSSAIKPKVDASSWAAITTSQV